MTMQHPVFQQLDHVAILVPNTEEALRVWRDVVGLHVLFSEVVNGGTIRLTHLDLGNTQLQLVEPLTEDHPLKGQAAAGARLHHLCFTVDEVSEAQAALASTPLGSERAPHQGTLGKRAMFLNIYGSQGIPLEITGG
ncbi:MAG: VOC family protein [Planctomycetaceae bacterium]|jgi:methylmalonyl-CoA/ethylmalonyl-CoA epimerase